MFRSQILGATGIFAFAIAACGGIDEPDLFSSSGGSTSHTDGGTGTSKDSGSTTTHDSGVTTGVDSGGGGGVVDSGTIPPTTGIFCGDDSISGDPTYCTGEDICCASGQQSGSASYFCGANATCKGTDDLVIPCDKSSECPGGRICCGTFVTGNAGITPSYYSQVRCAPSCTGTAARTFCDPNNGDDDCAAVSGSTCVESGALPGFHVCTSP